MAKIRLDQLVFEKGYADSREKAKAIVMSGNVYVNGQKADKPGLQLPEGTEIEVRIKELPFVSRGGYKLDKALKVFPIEPEGKICIDCGASTGGFTDVLLQHGAKKVYSVDVGYGQLAWKLRNDERVINLERTNLRHITSQQIPESPELAVCDVSFISLKLIIPAVREILAENADFMCLIKPQFEAGREQVGKKGVVRDRKIHEAVVSDIVDFASSSGFTVLGLDYSPIRGPEGNIEYLLHMKKGTHEAPELSVAKTVELSHQELEK